MIHCRTDYTDRIQDTAHLIPDQEPVFLIRAQDNVGAQAVRAWAHIYRTNGGSDTVYLAVMRHADRMEAWPHKKMADTPAEMLLP